MTNLLEVVVDSDTLSLYLKNFPKVTAQANGYLSVHRELTFSIITRFEVLRGLKIKSAATQINKFNAICRYSRILEISDEIIERAADIYASLYQRGQLIGDADILIAATALDYDLPIVTNNEKHFNRINNLQVLNWNK